MSRRPRSLALAIAAAMAALIAWLIWPHDAPATAPIATSNGSARTSNQVAAPPIAGATREDRLDGMPIIDEVTVEKPEVCAGEENLISVKAHTRNGTDAFLGYFIGNMAGPRVPLVRWDRGALPPDMAPRIIVSGKANVQTSVSIPNYVVKDCTAEHSLQIHVAKSTNTESEYALSATLGNTRGASFVPVIYHWSFGDGSTQTTSSASTIHDYDNGKQDTMYTTLLVEVEAEAVDGQRVRGRTSLQLANQAFESFAYKGLVRLFIELTPRFPVMGPDGTVDQGVRIYHYQPEPVTITRIERVRQRKTGEDTTSVPAPDVLDQTTIPPGRGLVIHVRLNMTADPDIVVDNYHLTGISRDGHQALGTFGVMAARRMPSLAHHDGVVADPLLQAKILAAREILQQEFVSADDLRKLEQAGRFRDLKPAPLFVAPSR